MVRPVPAREEFRGPGQGEILGPGEVVGSADVQGRVPEHGHGGTGDVRPGHGCHDAVPGRSADNTVRARQQRQEVQVEVVPQEGEVHPRGLDPLLGGEVVPAQREGGIRCRAEERGVDDVLHAGSGRRVHKGAVLLQPVLGLGGGDHKERLHPLEGCFGEHRIGVGDDGGDCAFQLRRPAGVAHEQPLRAAGVGQLPGHQAAQVSGGTGDGERWRRGHGLSLPGRGRLGLRRVAFGERTDRGVDLRP